MSTNIDMGLDEIIKMNKKGAQKKKGEPRNSANLVRNQQTRRPVRRQNGFKTTPGKKPFNQRLTQARGSAQQTKRPNITNRNRSQTLRNARQPTSRQTAGEGVKSRQINQRLNTVNRRRNLPPVSIVPTTSKKPLARTGVLQSDILARELEMKKKALQLKATLDASRSKKPALTRNQSAGNRIRNQTGPARTRGGRNMGGVAATTLTIQVPNSNLRSNRPNTKVNPVVTKQVTQIQTQIKTLQNRLTNIQKRQLFQIQKQVYQTVYQYLFQGNQARRQQRQMLANRVQPRVNVQARIQRGRNTQDQTRANRAVNRRVIW